MDVQHYYRSVFRKVLALWVGLNAFVWIFVAVDFLSRSPRNYPAAILFSLPGILAAVLTFGLLSSASWTTRVYELWALLLLAFLTVVLIYADVAYWSNVVAFVFVLVVLGGFRVGLSFHNLLDVDRRDPVPRPDIMPELVPREGLLVLATVEISPSEESP